MGNRATTRLSLIDGTALYWMPWGSACYQIPNIGEFVFDTIQRQQPVTVTAWETWDKAGTLEKPAIARKRIDSYTYPGDRDYAYELHTTPAGIRFTALQRDRDPLSAGPWKTLLDRVTVQELLTAGADETRAFVRRNIRLRKEHRVEPDAKFWGGPTVSELENWQRECETRATLYRTLYAPGLDVQTPDPEHYPARRDGQTDTDHWAQRAQYCASMAAGSLADHADSPDPAQHADGITPAARGYLLEYYRIHAEHLRTT